MLIAEARVQTERSSRYLVQPCRHEDEAERAHPQLRRTSNVRRPRVISFDRGRCTLRARPGVLTLRAEPRRGKPASA
jgi:hypothetical protein